MSILATENLDQWVDAYFLKTKKIIGHFGDKKVTYALFLRRPVISAPRLMIEWLQRIAKKRKADIDIELCVQEGKWVGAGEPLAYITGSFSMLVDLETEMLMKLGSPCVAAYNAFTMATDLPNTSFIAMDARHCAGREMAELMSYGACVGSARAKRKSRAIGFIGTSLGATSSYFGNGKALGTMPHALIGYAGSTVKAAQMYHDIFPEDNLVVLVDYFGQEISDSLACCKKFSDLAKQGKLSLRLDTSGGRFVEGLDPARSYAVLEKWSPKAIRGYRSDEQLKHLVGTGVSAAALFWLRENLDKNGFDQVKIVASSGFSPEKCQVMALAKAPIDVIGTGSYLPERWTETYATADIVAYDDQPKVKLGREFLLRKKNS